MAAPQLLRSLALAAPFALLAGCGGTPAEVDTAEVTRPDSAKPAPTQAPATAPAPEATPAKDAPKG